MTAGGIYSKYMTQAEADSAVAVDLNSVDDELRLLRVRLARALAKESDSLELAERIVRDDEMTEERYRQRDYPQIVNQIIDRIHKLTSLRLALVQDQRSTEGDISDEPITSVQVEVVG